MPESNRNPSWYEEGGAKADKFVQTLVDAKQHKMLKFIALKRDMTLAELLRSIVENFLKEEKDHGRGKNRKQEK